MTAKAVRVPWIDQARGWGMILVMLGHAPFADFPHKLIYSFHIPFFFALSGWLHNPAKNPEFFGLVKARWKTLILPYFLYSAIGYAGLVPQWLAGHRPWGLTPWTPIPGTLLGWRNSTPYNGTLWFVACLVVTEFGYHWIHRAVRRSPGKALLVSIIPMVCLFWFGLRLPFPYPWSADAAQVAIFFFAFGQFVKCSRDSSWLNWLTGSKAWLIAVAWGVATIFSGKVDMYSIRYDTPVLFVVAALLGILGAFLLAPKLPEFRWIEYVGRHTLVLLALHEWFAFGFARAIQSRLFPLGLQPGQWLLFATGITYTLIALVILWPICILFDRWAPILVGGGKK